MSLNGLDDAKVTEAFMLASAEPGGWFLLRYLSRDEVELLGSGNGGVTEVRNAVAAYEEQSPLYGFLKYRRRNVLIKYLPEGCSRLIQVRVAVHFNAVCERFSPYDSQFDMDSAEDLRDSRLSAKCSLHAASGSNSSTSSLRRKHLMEIVEEDEDENQQPVKRQSLLEDAFKPPSDEKEDLRPVTPAVTLNADLATSPEESKFASGSEMPHFVGADDVDSARRMSSQSGRDIFTSHSGFSYTIKPKVKLGPRPSLDTNPRPQTAGNFRPVSSIPAGFKLFGRGKKSPKKGSEKDSSPGKDIGSPLKEDFGAALTVPEDERPDTSSGLSTKSGVGSMAKGMGITPEKARLKKAMQLRKKKAAAQAAGAEGVPAVPALPLTPTTPMTPVTPTTPSVVEEPSPRASRDDEISEVTQTDSRPASPVIASSEAEGSTKASSVSEQTAQEEEKSEEDATKDEAVPEVSRSLEVDCEAPAEADVLAEVEPPVEPETETIVESSLVVQTPPPLLEQQEDAQTEMTDAQLTEPEADGTSNTPVDISGTIKSPPEEPSDPSQTETPEIPKPTAIVETIAQPSPSDISTPPPIPTVETFSPVQDTFFPRPKRKAAIQPIVTDLPTTTTSRPVSPTDSLLDELTSATVHEAQPMFVAKTPVTSSFPSLRTSSASPVEMGTAAKPHMVRTVSNPVRSTLIPPSTESSARTVSGGGAAYLHQITQQRSADGNLAVAKKTGMGSSISQRIKALEMLSAETASAPGSRPSSTFFAVKKTPSRSPSVADRTNSFTKDSLSRPTTATSKNGSPETVSAFHPGPFTRNRSGSISSRLSMFEPNGSPNQTPRGRPETVSVTAKIIRDSPSRTRPELTPSPLLIDHRTEIPSPVDKEPKSRRSSIAAVKDFIKDRRKSTDTTTTLSPTRSPPSTHQNSSFAGRLSMSSRRSTSRDRETVDSMSDDTASEKLSRSARLMRRLSSTLTRSTPKMPTSPPLVEEPAPPVNFGDVNVQFPDTLLWKRRHLTLSCDVLIFGSPDGAQRKWALEELRVGPYAPDVEVQELPNSVVLEMRDGGSVQVASESRAGQMGILQVLRDAHAGLQ